MVIGIELNRLFGNNIANLNQELNLLIRPMSSSLWVELNRIHSNISLITQDIHRRYGDR
jgi:hypothetical protein